MPQWKANFFFFPLDESSQDVFCTMRMAWICCCLKIQLACHCFIDGSAITGKPKCHQWVLIYTQYCWILTIAFGLLRSYCLTFAICLFFFVCFFVCRIHVRYTMASHCIKNPDESCFKMWISAPLKYTEEQTSA